MTSIANRLGEIRAESDHQMLDKAFLETADYRTLLESADKIVVVGRRGTGKSALTYRLQKTLSAYGRPVVITLTPDEDQVIGIRPIIRKLGDNYNLIKAAVRIAWEVLLLMEILYELSKHYKFSKTKEADNVKTILRGLFRERQNVAFNLRMLLKRGLQGSSPEEAIADLAEVLHLRELKDGLNEALTQVGREIFILIDCLDEGYQPDRLGIAYIAGIIQGTLNINSLSDKVRTLLFIRDNMFRAVAAQDPDYTRNIEGSSLRLHWGEQQLLNLATMRLRAAFDIEQENDIRVWNQVTAQGLVGRDGFRKCLRLTLYRPRDLLALLNQAFFSAGREGRKEIIDRDIEDTAKEISQARLDDLVKEYSSIFPSLRIIVGAFLNYKPECTVAEIRKLLNEALFADKYEPIVQQDIAFFETPDDAIRALYGVGFLGISESTSGAYSFCHDGRSPDLTIRGETKLLVHPCYQVALNLSASNLDPEEAREIHDDYEIEIESISQQQRNRKIGQLVSRVRGIEPGSEDSSEFEEWCKEAIRICFAGTLRNIELHPNKDAPQRRDIVASNAAEQGFWKRVRDDYGTRQVIFEVKNYSDLKPGDFRQLETYLTDAYGKLGFIITRNDNKEPDRERDLQWIRQIYWQNDNRLIVLLPYKWLITFLEKLRSPQKHDAVDKIIDKILDTYHRSYLNESVKRQKRR